MSLPSLSLDPAGPVAETVEDLWWLMFWLGAAVFVVFLVLLARGAVRPGVPAADDGLPPAGGDETPVVRRWVLLGGVLMPFAVLVVVLGATLATMRATPSADQVSADESVVVEVVGHQWWYEVRYPGRDVTTRNELHLPLDTPIVLRVTSADVIHSFWVPELGGKIDMLPEDVNTLVVEASEPGTFQSRCAEFCGLHHTTMKLEVVAEDEDAFARWLEEQR